MPSSFNVLRDPVRALPSELQAQIFADLPVPDLMRFARTDRFHWHGDEELWRALGRRALGATPSNARDMLSAFKINQGVRQSHQVSTKELAHALGGLSGLAGLACGAAVAGTAGGDWMLKHPDSVLVGCVIGFEIFGAAFLAGAVTASVVMAPFYAHDHLRHKWATRHQLVAVPEPTFSPPPVRHPKDVRTFLSVIPELDNELRRTIARFKSDNPYHQERRKFLLDSLCTQVPITHALKHNQFALAARGVVQSKRIGERDLTTAWDCYWRKPTAVRALFEGMLEKVPEEVFGRWHKKHVTHKHWRYLVQASDVRILDALLTPMDLADCDTVLNRCDPQGDSLFHAAAEHGHYDTFATLWDHGGDLHNSDNFAGATVRQLAYRRSPIRTELQRAGL